MCYRTPGTPTPLWSRRGAHGDPPFSLYVCLDSRNRCSHRRCHKPGPARCQGPRCRELRGSRDLRAVRLVCGGLVRWVARVGCRPVSKNLRVSCPLCLQHLILELWARNGGQGGGW